MKKLSNHLLAVTIVSARKQKKLSQQALADLTGMNRSVLSKLEAEEYTPSIAQLEELARVLNFDITDMFQERTIDPFSQINSTTRKDYTTDPGCVFKHGTPPVRYGSEEYLKCHWRFRSEMMRSG